ncbi:uncharacterized protein LOC112020583 [Quercus suber]|uniref:uncharacterized protein LOC112020583 n=1 Tax=Quercus suber TaxID=58331 RepID=UPI000CE252BE|nr:histone-lysine N-methyltransferase, H3 lysine-79 specific-like [Quercus suber]POF15120.1 hypothetical protein CFP56_60871 [Quercus suber]
MEVDQVKNSNNNRNNNSKNKKKNGPSVPSNFVTIVQLEERWLQEKQSKLKKEKEQEEAAAQEEKERQRKLQLQKLREKEEEVRKRKLVQSQGRLKFNADDRKPDRRQQIWRENRRAAVQVSPAKKPEEPAALVAGEVGIGNVSAQKEQTGEEAKENNNEKKNKMKKKTKKKKKMKPRSDEEKEKEKEEVEVTGGASHAPKVIGEKENSPARTNVESEGTKSEFRPTAEIERKFGDFAIGKGNVRVTRPNTGIYHSHRDNRGFGGRYRDYKGSSKFADRKEVQKPSGAGMVWVKKGEIGGVHNQSSITEPKKLN